MRKRKLKNTHATFVVPVTQSESLNSILNCDDCRPRYFRSTWQRLAIKKPFKLPFDMHVNPIELLFVMSRATLAADHKYDGSA